MKTCRHDDKVNRVGPLNNNGRTRAQGNTEPTTATPWIKASPTSQTAPGLIRSTLLPPPSTAAGFLRLVLLPSFGNSTPTLNRRSHLNPRGASVQAAQIAEKRPDHQADAHGQQQVQRRQVGVAGDVEGRAPEQRVELGLDGGRHSRGLGVEAVKGRRRRAGRFRRSHLERRGRGKNTSDVLTHRGSGRGGFGREGRGGHSGCSGYMGRGGETADRGDMALSCLFFQASTGGISMGARSMSKGREEAADTCMT